MMYLFVVILYFMGNKTLYHNNNFWVWWSQSCSDITGSHSCRFYFEKWRCFKERINSDGMTCTPTLTKIH